MFCSIKLKKKKSDRFRPDVKFRRRLEDRQSTELSSASEENEGRRAFLLFRANRQRLRRWSEGGSKSVWSD